jgi:hypothetical protein
MVNVECGFGGTKRASPQIRHFRIPLLLRDPGQRFRESFAPLARHLQFEQEAALHGVADGAFELAEVAEVGGEAVADLADHGHVDDHPERRHALGAAGEGAKLAPRIIPVRQRIASCDGDLHRSLVKKILNDAHGISSRTRRDG